MAASVVVGIVVVGLVVAVVGTGLAADAVGVDASPIPPPADKLNMSAAAAMKEITGITVPRLWTGSAVGVRAFRMSPMRSGAAVGRTGPDANPLGRGVSS